MRWPMRFCEWDEFCAAMLACACANVLVGGIVGDVGAFAFSRCESGCAFSSDERLDEGAVDVEEREEEEAAESIVESVVAADVVANGELRPKNVIACPCDPSEWRSGRRKRGGCRGERPDLVAESNE